jgi:chaperonin GroES
MIHKVVPVHNYLRIKLDQPPEKTSSGLFLPDNAKDRITSGLVLDAGEGIWKDGVFIKTRIQKGMHVVFNQFALTDGRTFGGQAIISEDDVLGIVLEDN